MIEFRPFDESDLPLLRTWLEREHVRLWWREPIEYELAHDRAGRWIIVVDGRPVGMIQSYDEEVDLLIGEEELIGRGLGPQVLSKFAREVVFARPELTAVRRHGRRGQPPLLARLREGRLPPRRATSRKEGFRTG